MTVAEVLSVIAIAFGLSADCFAVAISSSISGKNHSRYDILRVASSFAFFQALMPVLGWLAGRSVVGLVEQYDHWVAFGLLAGVGGHMLWQSLHPKNAGTPKLDVTRGGAMLLLSIATSIDALAVGLSFAFLQINMAVASLTIGLICFGVTFSGFLLGRKSNRFLGERAETVGGIILIAIGLRILLSHLL